MKPQQIRLGGLNVDRLVPSGKEFPVPLIFLRGACYDTEILHPWMQMACEAGREAIAIRRDNFPNVRGVSIQDYAEQVLDLINSLNCPVDLTGHSMGGLVAQMVAHHRAIRKIVLVASVPPRGVLLPFPVRVVRNFGRGHYLRALLTGVFTWRDEDLDQYLLHELGLLARDQVGQLFGEESSRAALQMLPRVKVEKIPVDKPSLVISGRDDRLVPPEKQRFTASFHGSTYMEIPGCGHAPMLGGKSCVMMGRILKWLAE